MTHPSFALSLHSLDLCLCSVDDFCEGIPRRAQSIARVEQIPCCVCDMSRYIPGDHVDHFQSRFSR